MRVAVLSDIHGNLVALEAVLADLAAQGGADALAIAGDLCLDGPRPREVLARVRGLGCAVVQGNTDRDLALAPEQTAPLEYAGLLAWTRARIGEEGLAYLGALPFSHRITAPDGRSVLLIVHANPKDQDRHLPPLAPENQIAPLLADLPTEVKTVAFGHLHIPYVRDVGRLRLIDVASVGLPKDGDRRAGYGLLTWVGDGWLCEQRRVEYPVEETIDQIRAAAPPDADDLIRALLRARYANMVEARGGKGAARRASGPRVTATANPATPPPVPPSLAAQEAPAPPRNRRVAAARPQPATPPEPAVPPVVPPSALFASPTAASPPATRRVRHAAPTESANVPAAPPPIRGATDTPPMADAMTTAPPQAALAPSPAPIPEGQQRIGDEMGPRDTAPAHELSPAKPKKRGRVARERALLQADVPYPTILPDLLEGRLEALLKQLAAVRDEDDPESVHALRVATRHLRVALDSAAPFLGAKAHKRQVRDVRALAAAAGRVRDADVMLDSLRARAIQEAEVERAGIEALIDALSVQRATARDELDPVLDRWMDEDEGDSAAAVFRRALTAIKARRKLGTRALTGRVAAEAIEAALARFEKRGRQFAAGDAVPDAAHRLRIATKRLRYSVELFASLLPTEADERLRELQDLQALLGTMHDHDVLTDLLAWERAQALERQLHQLERAVFTEGSREERLAAVREGLSSSDSFSATAPGIYALLIDTLAERATLEARLHERWSASRRDELARRLSALVSAIAPQGEGDTPTTGPNAEDHDG